MHLRFFLSSPGDVAEERKLAQHLIEQELPKDELLRGQITCEVMCWDDPNAPVMMSATQTPQESVNRNLIKPSACDAVIVILWSRLGTPLPDAYKKPDGSPYLSGTEWEYEDAISSTQPPLILVYRRKTLPKINDDDPEAKSKLDQYDRVKIFFSRFRNPDGSQKGGYAEYDTPDEFCDILKHNLRAFIKQKLDTMKAEAGKTKDKKAPPPYTEIAKAFKTGQVVPVIGSGVNKSVRSSDTHWNSMAPQFLPSGMELSRYLAENIGFPSQEERDHLAEVATYYETSKSRPSLRTELRQILGQEMIAGDSIPSFYRFLASVQKPLLIITTNFDCQLERAFHEAEKPYDLVVYGSDFKTELANTVLWWPHGSDQPETPASNKLQIDLDSTTVIFKMHGSIISKTDEFDSFVITEKDFVDFLSRINSQSAIPKLFKTRCDKLSLLFLGYDLQEWNFRTIFNSLYGPILKRHKILKEVIPSWSISEHISELEEYFWQKQDVYPFAVNIEDFVTTLQARCKNEL